MKQMLSILLIALLFALAIPSIAQEEAPLAPAGLTFEQIASIPHVDPGYLPVDETVLYDRAYRRLVAGTTVYNAPNGSVVRTIAAGFNYVTALGGDQGGWTMINPNEWVRTEAIEGPFPVSSFTGYVLPGAMPQQYFYAWALDYVYPSRVPGGDGDRSFPRVNRHDRLNVYSYQFLDGHVWYQVGSDQWLHQFDVAMVLPLQTVPEGVNTQLWISIDLYEQVLILYDGITPIFATLTSTGLPRWPTNEGVFNITYRTPRTQMSLGTVGDDFYLLEEVPWTMYFDDNIALHGTYWHDYFGYRRSHGCVNLSITDAKWIYERVAEYMGGALRSEGVEQGGVSVFVYTSGTY